MRPFDAPGITMTLLPASFSFVLITLAALAAPAAAAPSAEVRLTAYKLIPAVAKNGAPESRQALKDVRPGDTVEYEAVYVNGSGQTAHDVQLTVPVPVGGVALIARQPAPLAGSGSLDGSHFSPLPLMRSEVLPDGRQVLHEVPLAELRALRWSLGDVPADTSRSVRARMQLPATSPFAGTTN
jgi:hypothetical protein